MLLYIVKRLAAAVATILLIMTITFFLMNTIPGSPFLTEKSTPQQIQLANEKYGLDKPLIVQLKNYIVNYLHGDLGVSLKMQEGTPVKDILFKQGKFVLSIKLGICAIIVAVLFGIPLGCIAAYKRGTWIDGFSYSLCSQTALAAYSFRKPEQLAVLYPACNIIIIL